MVSFGEVSQDRASHHGVVRAAGARQANRTSPAKGEVIFTSAGEDTDTAVYEGRGYKEEKVSRGGGSG